MDTETVLPVLIISFFGIIIIGLVAYRMLRSRRSSKPTDEVPAPDLATWADSEGDVVDRWTGELDRGLKALSEAGDDQDELAAQASDLLGRLGVTGLGANLRRAIDRCPDQDTRAALESMRAAGLTTIQELQQGQPDRASEAITDYHAERDRAAGLLEPSDALIPAGR